MMKLSFYGAGIKNPKKLAVKDFYNRPDFGIFCFKLVENANKQEFQFTIFRLIVYLRKRCSQSSTSGSISTSRKKT